MTHSFFFKPTVTIELSDTDFDLLFSIMSSHYDSTVTYTTEVGGFMYGAKNRRKFNISDKDIEVNDKGLQLMIKSLEMYTSDEALKLSSELWKILREMSDSTKRVNTNHLSEKFVNMINLLASKEITQIDFDSYIDKLMKSSYYEDHQKDAFKGILEISKEISNGRALKKK